MDVRLALVCCRRSIFGRGGGYSLSSLVRLPPRRDDYLKLPSCSEPCWLATIDPPSILPSMLGPLQVLLFSANFRCAKQQEGKYHAFSVVKMWNSANLNILSKEKVA